MEEPEEPFTRYISEPRKKNQMPTKKRKLAQTQEPHNDNPEAKKARTYHWWR